MLSTSPEPAIPLKDLIGERRVTFRNLNWQSYQQILQALGEQRSSRLTYDRGTLEITMPLEDHEFYRVMIGRFIYTLVECLGLNVKSIGSTTLDYPELDRGAEPDDAYYIQNQPQVTGRNIDLTQDPPPDLIVEVDITHTDLNKNKLYAAMGVPEFWRFNGQVLQIYQLHNQNYVEVETSPTFPTVPKVRLYEFLEDCKQNEISANRSLRQWAQVLMEQHE